MASGDDDGGRAPLTAQLRETWHIVMPLLLLVLAAFWYTSRFVQPAPPKEIAVTTGSQAGAYYRFGQQYAKALARSGIKLDVRASAGSVENVRLLADAGSGVSVALLQGGIADARQLPNVVSLGRIFLEPIWVFYPGSETYERLSQLKGKRLAIGPEGSGTRALAEALLKPNDAHAAPTTLLPLVSQPAIDAMANGDVDAVFLVAAPETPLIQSLLRDPRFKLMSFAHGEAYARLFPYLTRIVLPQGVIDLARNIPATDVTLVAAEAALVARADLHPALVGLLVEAAHDAHAPPGLFNKPGEFPRLVDPEFPMSDDAVRVYKTGQSFLKRVLPFWLATFIERMIIMIVPIATILLPLFKIVPMLYQWRIKRRILYWYAQLKTLERKIGRNGRAPSDEAFRAEIDRIEHAVSVIPLPLQFSEQLYNLRGAVDLVRQRIYGPQRLLP